MSTPTVDRRIARALETIANSVPKPAEEISIENMVSEGSPSRVDEAVQNAMDGGLTILTPEQVVAQEQAPVETDDGTEARKLADQQAQMEQDEAALRQTLQDCGPCVLLRFEHGNSLSYLVTPGQGVSDRALLAACEDLVAKIKVAQARELWYNYDEREADQEALAERLSLPGQNRQQRRAKRFAGRK